MINKEEYVALMARLNAPENSELRKMLSPVPNGRDLAFHLKRIKEYIDHFEKADSISKQLLELDYSTSLRHAKQLMDEQGWK